MAAIIHEPGERFGRLVVIERDTGQKPGGVRWLCRCDCGNTKAISGSHLRTGFIQSCGCMRREHAAAMRSPPAPREDLTGQRFGLLTARRPIWTPNEKARWVCECDCGRETIVVSTKLKSGSTVSCGCFRAEQSRQRAVEGRAIGYRRREAHPRWNADLPESARAHRREPEVQIWRRQIVQRDGRCLRCGSTDDLAAHHVLAYRDHPEVRFDLNNGATLCGGCHRAFHRQHGRTGFSRTDFVNFLAEAAT